ncbi:hypothetical protein RYZ26_10890 [Terasakiella sp. A23]|uniref:hypothetical protein n=1 Tax=Terasakiella sp. FCG-A23 TaxID=3080561 RepID=UPI00295431AA|nr:hypothetical protein [Terasakiella sp. A23]MDV7340101.1 hypothetical protein [Terasakiella sp. A23]
MLALFSLVLGGFIYAALLKDHINPSKKSHISPYPEIKVEDLGKRVDDLKRKYPDLLLTQNRDGWVVGRHKFEGAHYTVWFIAENKEFVAFRIKATQTYSHLKEKETLKFFGTLFGRPFDNYCKGKSTYAIESCHYKWWVRDAVSLDVYTRTKKDQSVVLDAITTDTYLTSKHHKIIRTFLPIQ